MFFTFFNMFSSIVLLPLYLQNLMGYTATLAGLVLGPGSLATVVALQTAGQLYNRINAKFLLLFGILVVAYSIHLMSQFNLYASFGAVMWPRVLLGFGMGFIFIPLTNTTLSTVKKEDMANATAIFNLLRNLGGSFGVAFVTTMLTRQSQIHQARLIDHLTPFDPAYRAALERGRALLEHYATAGPASERGALGLIYEDLVRQASMLAFNDAFFLLAVLMACLVPLLIFLRKGSPGQAGPMH
jgi:DHA2 family multidrug resistance protein